ncbi:MAG: hypothetical protein ACI30L_05215 [Muribaculaceae bacterium]
MMQNYAKMRQLEHPFPQKFGIGNITLCSPPAAAGANGHLTPSVKVDASPKSAAIFLLTRGFFIIFAFDKGSVVLGRVAHPHQATCSLS